MRTIALVMLIVGTTLIHAQDGLSDQAASKDFQESLRLSFLLFPALKDRNGTFFQQYEKNIPPYPTLAKDVFLPIFASMQAASQLGVEPLWSALTDSEKKEVAAEQTHYARLLVDVICSQRRSLAAVSSSGGTATTSFNPDALENPVARQMLEPQPSQQPIQGQSQGQSWAPPPPLTTTAIDPQTGDVVVIQH